MDYRTTILGSGPALPNINAFHSSQMLKMNSKLFLIDCGEGCQIRLRQYHQKLSAMSHVFITHLHGDHCLGLPGLLSTLGLMGRTAPLYIHAHGDLERVMRPMIDYFCAESPFEIVFCPFDPYQHAVIFSDRTLDVTSIPLKHRVPTCGFLFKERPRLRHLRRDMCQAFDIPISQYKLIKEGSDYITPEGEVVCNSRLTTAATASKSFAYISDTAYLEKIVPLIEGVDCLYHEATFLKTDTVRMKKTMHSSAAQAATIAKLAGVGRLIIGHHSSRYTSSAPFVEEAREIFPNTVAAIDGTNIVF